MAHEVLDVMVRDHNHTTGAETANLGQIGIPDRTNGLMRVRVMCVRDSDLASKAWTVEALVRRSGGAVVVLENIPAPPNLFASAADQTALAGATIAVFSDSGFFGVSCTGMAATPLSWSVEIDGRLLTVL